MADSVFIKITEMKQFQKSMLLNIPNAFCILNQKGDQVLFNNQQFSQLAFIQNQKNNLSPLDQTTYQLPFQQVFYFFKQLYISLNQIQNYSELKLQQNILESRDEEDNEIYFDILTLLEQIVENQNGKSKSYQFKSKVIDFDAEEDQQMSSFEIAKEIILDVRIKTGINYKKKEAIFINLYDISTQLQSIYYQKLNVFKNQLIKSISHELRTRLNIIQGMISMVQSLLQDNQIKNQFNECNKLLQTAYNNCRIQAYIIGSIIDYNLIEDQQNELKNEKCRITNIINDAISLFEEEAQFKNIQLRFCKDDESTREEDQIISIDVEKVMSILVHVISNSIKFTNSQGLVTIELTKIRSQRDNNSVKQSVYMSVSRKSKHQSEGSEYQQIKLISRKSVSSKRKKSLIRPQKVEDIFCIIITDNGIGIQPERMRVLQNIINQKETNQVEQCSDKSQGYNLGIRVTTQLLNLINNQTNQWMYIQSIPNQETKVQIQLRSLPYQRRISDIDDQNQSFLDEEPIPYIQPTQKKFNISPRMESSSQYCSPKRICTCETDILIVDDEPYNLLVLEYLFKQYNQKVIKAYNGQECLDIIKQRIERALNEKHNCKILKAIFMDYQMPILNGEDATKQIIKLCKEKNINLMPIFGCTGFSSKQDVNSLLNAGMVDVFIKPITKKIIEQTLKTIDMKQIEVNIFSSKLDHINIDNEEIKLIE